MSVGYAYGSLIVPSLVSSFASLMAEVMGKTPVRMRFSAASVSSVSARARER